MWDILIWIFLFIVGYFIIFFAADVFLDNLKGLCIIYNVSPFIIGLLVLGIDPEESIASIIAATNNLQYIAVGNVIGNSIIALTIPFAIPAFFYSVKYEPIAQYYFSLIYISMICILTGILFFLGLFFIGFICIIIYILYLIKNVRNFSAKNITISPTDGESKDVQLKIEKNKNEKKSNKFILVIIGFIFIFLGGELLIISAEKIIILTSIPETFFGFVIIAIVTNVEEITLVLKSIKKQSVDIALGGMIGKIIWNLTFTFGISGIIIMNIQFTWIVFWNWIILLILIIYFNYISRKKIFERIEGLILMLIFVCFITINFVAISI
ncbi:MAG: hypothetical protein HWN81_18795 [Candidatus Lokiarchaeota archaeon]|nr:hypothetical protein [Candidatus Lokiarchaeota archaeon]